MPRFYDVFIAGASEQELSDVGVAIAARWVLFALGKAPLGGHVVAFPTGRYAASIRVEKRSPTHVAVISDEEFAPEARILEEGHRRIDLKRYASLAGRTLPMHRGAGPPVIAGAGSSASVFATARRGGFSGYARVPSRVTSENADSWIIPAMRAWSPAMHLAELARRGELILSL